MNFDAADLLTRMDERAKLLESESNLERLYQVREHIRYVLANEAQGSLSYAYELEGLCEGLMFRQSVLEYSRTIAKSPEFQESLKRSVREESSGRVRARIVDGLAKHIARQAKDWPQYVTKALFLLVEGAHRPGQDVSIWSLYRSTFYRVKLGFALKNAQFLVQLDHVGQGDDSRLDPLKLPDCAWAFRSEFQKPVQNMRLLRGPSSDSMRPGRLSVEFR